MKKTGLAYPYIIWMILFTVVPLLLVFYYAVTKTVDGSVVFTIEHLQRVFKPDYMEIMLRSIMLALACTAFCLLLGYPVSYILSTGTYAKKGFLLFLFVMPMWMNYLLRTYAWLTILETNGIINSILTFLGFGKVQILYTDNAVLLGMVYNFIPFMILPIHSVLKKIDKRLIEAAQDLGADSKTVFIKVIFPLSLPGVISGITMVFMPAVTTFVISDLLGGKKKMLIGNLIEKQFLGVNDWNFGSAISLILILIIIVSTVLSSAVDKDTEGGTLF